MGTRLLVSGMEVEATVSPDTLIHIYQTTGSYGF